MKTTPGPWEVSGQEVRSPKPSCIVAWCGGGSTFGSDGSRVIDRAESEANARLIAITPTMLSALKAMDAALMKSGWQSPDSGFAQSNMPKSTREAWIQIRSAISQAEPQDHTPSRS